MQSKTLNMPRIVTMSGPQAVNSNEFRVLASIIDAALVENEKNVVYNEKRTKQAYAKEIGKKEK